MADEGLRPSGWFWDTRTQRWYYYDPGTDSLIDNTRQAQRRPSSVDPRRYYFLAAQQAAVRSQSAGLVPGFTETQPVDALSNAVSNLGLGQAESEDVQPTPPEIRQGPHGERIVSVYDPNTRVRTIYVSEPAERMTDPELLHKGIQAHRFLHATDNNETEQLYSTFRVRNHPFFVLGRVFLVLWVEPAGENTTVVTSVERSDPDPPGFSRGRYQERVYSKVRRFVVIREGKDYCSALPVVTYGRQGVGKRGVVKAEHAIVHTTRDSPRPVPAELPHRNEDGMRSQPIRIVPDQPTDKLDSMSRIDFGKIYTIQHNIKVKPFGNVHERSRGALFTQFNNVWKKDPQGSDSGIAFASSSTGNQRSGAPVTGTRHRRSMSGATRSTRSERSVEATIEEEEEDEEEEAGKGSDSAQEVDGTGAESRQRNDNEVLRVATEHAQRARSAMTELIRRGYTQQQALDYMATQLRRRDSRYTRETATHVIQARLAFGRRSPTEGDEDHRRGDSQEAGASSDEEENEEE